MAASWSIETTRRHGETRAPDRMFNLRRRRQQRFMFKDVCSVDLSRRLVNLILLFSHFSHIITALDTTFLAVECRFSTSTTSPTKHKLPWEVGNVSNSRKCGETWASENHELKSIKNGRRHTLCAVLCWIVSWESIKFLHYFHHAAPKPKLSTSSLKNIVQPRDTSLENF